MNKLIISLIFLLAIITNIAEAKPIKLNIPEDTLAQAIKNILPIEIDTNSDSLTGKVNITDISDFKLTKDQLACKLSLLGKDMKAITKIGSTKIALNIGETQASLTTKIAIRYDKKSQSLYIIPSIADVTSSSDNQLGAALMPLLDGKEFKIDIDQIKPIIAETSNKDIMVSMILEDIIIKDKEIEAQFSPKVSSTKK
ncbi:MAG: hypothetical protein OCC45_13990 [Desulfotalea sp.]